MYCYFCHARDHFVLVFPLVLLCVQVVNVVWHIFVIFTSCFGEKIFTVNHSALDMRNKSGMKRSQNLTSYRVPEMAEWGPYQQHKLSRSTWQHPLHTAAQEARAQPPSCSSLDRRSPHSSNNSPGTCPSAMTPLWSQNLLQNYRTFWITGKA